MGQSLNSSAFLNFITARNVFTSRIPDPGHDSPEEITAMKQIEAYARNTGPLGGGGTAVQLMGENARAVVAWMSPHFDDPIIIRVKADCTFWAHADSFDEGLKTNDWMRLHVDGNWASHRHAVRADEIIRNVFPQFSVQRNG